MQDLPPVRTDDDARRPAAVVVSGPVGGGRQEPPGHSDKRHRHVSLWLSLVAAAAVGIGVAILGTALHGQLWDLAGTTLPLGAAAAVLLAGSAAVCIAVWARNVYLSPVVGGVAYLLVGLLAASEDQPLVLTDLSMEPLLPSAVAGSIWVFGLAVVTVLASMLSWWVLRPRRAGTPSAV